MLRYDIESGREVEVVDVFAVVVVLFCLICLFFFFSFSAVAIVRARKSMLLLHEERCGGHVRGRIASNFGRTLSP